jgi:hypothetical protein
MNEQNETKTECCPITNFFSRLFQKLDKKLEEKTKSKSCCCSGKQDQDPRCSTK